MTKNIFLLFYLFSTLSFVSNAQNSRIALDIYDQDIFNLLESSISHRDTIKNNGVGVEAENNNLL